MAGGSGASQGNLARNVWVIGTGMSGEVYRVIEKSWGGNATEQSIRIGRRRRMKLQRCNEVIQIVNMYCGFVMSDRQLNPQ